MCNKGMQQSILVTGGAGYIGSHTCLELLDAGHNVTVVDNLSNANPASLHRVEELTGRKLNLHKVDLLDPVGLHAVFKEQHFDTVIHFAGLKAVRESTEIPLRYYHNNVTGTLVLLETMKRHHIHRLVFSSSATVYGTPPSLPIRENFPLNPTNPYGRTKLTVEHTLRDLAGAEPEWSIIMLRYFNPAGAHPSGSLGEDPTGTPNNLLPLIMQTAVGQHEKVSVFGGDYRTSDGTGTRDYIHVVDVALGHIAALKTLSKTRGCVAYNLGTCKPCTVLDVLKSASRTVGKQIPYEIVKRRAGDVAESYADPTLAASRLQWQATRNLDAMCADAWRWQKTHPNGYTS